MLTAEQMMTAQKANFETLFGLTNKAFEGVEKLVELNLQVAKASLSEAAATSTAALSIKDAQELLALQAGLLQPAAEKAVLQPSPVRHPGRHQCRSLQGRRSDPGRRPETDAGPGGQRGEERARWH